MTKNCSLTGMLFSYSLFNFVLCLYAGFVPPVYFCIMPLCLFRFLCSISFLSCLYARFVFYVQFRTMSLCLFRFLCSSSHYVIRLVSFSLFNFVLCLHACFDFPVQFRSVF